ncbi:cupin-like domain-containing protein, partial [Klebsiella pneumoniae]|uniref:cupin-like domain-containing protein n=1 Tax=Klebsiella pneumoniae TaxID=573 RepID=UPI0019535A9F
SSYYLCQNFLLMNLRPVDTYNLLEGEVFRKNYYEPKKPVVIKDLAKSWPAYQKWNWGYFKSIVGEHRVALYNNVKSDAYT